IHLRCEPMHHAERTECRPRSHLGNLTASTGFNSLILFSILRTFTSHGFRPPKNVFDFSLSLSVEAVFNPIAICLMLARLNAQRTIDKPRGQDKPTSRLIPCISNAYTDSTVSLTKENLSMCDYSLHGIKNRLADEGETLVVHRFYTGSKGLTSPKYLERAEKPKGFIAALKAMFAALPDECAVCIPDGAKLVLRSISPALQQAHDLCDTEPVTFRQLSADDVTYRDAVEFRNGLKVRLQELEEGQAALVVAVSPDEVEVGDVIRISQLPR